MNVNTYGEKPYTVAVLHGGPGAAGEVAPIARELAHYTGTLEPLQTADSVMGQVQELANALRRYASGPVTLIGHSWGAMLGYIVAALHPELVGKLIMVSSGCFDEEYAASITPTRLCRLSEKDREKVIALSDKLDGASERERNAAMAQLGRIFIKADSFDPFPAETDQMSISYHIFQKVWQEVVAMRADGSLKMLGSKIKCPVVAIHGEYDPHPVAGVKKPLESVVKEFRLIILEKCGHIPWIERQARDRFFQVLRDELR